MPANTPPGKKKVGRPKAEDPAVPYNLTLPSESAKQLDSLTGCFGKTRSSTIRFFIEAILEELGEEGLAGLRKARQYKRVEEERRIARYASKKVAERTRDHMQRLSGNRLGGDGQPIDWRTDKSQW